MAQIDKYICQLGLFKKAIIAQNIDRIIIILFLDLQRKGT